MLKEHKNNLYRVALKYMGMHVCLRVFRLKPCPHWLGRCVWTKNVTSYVGILVQFVGWNLYIVSLVIWYYQNYWHLLWVDYIFHVILFT